MPHSNSRGWGSGARLCADRGLEGASHRVAALVGAEQVDIEHLVCLGWVRRGSGASMTGAIGGDGGGLKKQV